MTQLRLTARILGDTKEDVLRCLRLIAAEIEAGEDEGDSDDETSDLSWSLSEEDDEEDEDEEEGPEQNHGPRSASERYGF